MISKLFLFIIILEYSFSIDIYEDDDKNFNQELKPVNINKNLEKISIHNNLNCEAFTTFVNNCTIEAAMIYNYSKKSPPLPAKINDWCRAIRYLTNCALDWNSECKDITENNFSEDSIKGHMHVVNNVCDDEWFLSQYDTLTLCIEATSIAWEACYQTFKEVVDRQKNSSNEWTHYVTHFYLCCARTRFRRCTLDTLFNTSSMCMYESAFYLQKFSVIVSEGDVFQECERNVLYANCPDGDPRPSGNVLAKLMNTGDYHPSVKTTNTANVFKIVCSLWCALVLCIFLIK